MRIKLEFASDKEVVIRSGYNSLIQGLIYDSVCSIEATKLHKKRLNLCCRFSFKEFLGQIVIYNKRPVLDMIKSIYGWIRWKNTHLKN